MTSAARQLDALVFSRPVEERDFWPIRRLLIETVPLAPVGFNWEVRRWDGQYFGAPRAGWRADWRAQLWQTQRGQIVGVAHPEGRGDLHLQLHPDHRHLETAMVAWAEGNLAVADDAGRLTLETFVYDYDVGRQRLLAARGYEKLSYGGVLRHMRLGHQPLEQVQLAHGYTLRTTQPDDLADCQQIADILNAAFKRDFHTAVEYQSLARNAPCIYPELDLVAEAADGRFAAYVGVAYDPVNRLAVFEPVCTHPQHQRLGLARALMVEGLHRLRARGARAVVVGTGDMIPANRLYDSIGFGEAYHGVAWRKVMTGD